MKTAIIVLTHYSKENILYHYNWHKQICDVKMIWNTTEKIDHPDITTLDMPGKAMVWNVTRILCHYAAKYDYDYYVLMAGDCYIIRKNWIPLTLQFMQKAHADVSMTHISKSYEHFKAQFYRSLIHVYKLLRSEIKWSMNICNVFTRKAVDLYNEHNNYKFYDEIDPYNCLQKRVIVKGNPYINYHALSASCLTGDTPEEIVKKIYKWFNFKHYKDLALELETEELDDTYIVHSVKDHKVWEATGIKVK